MTPLRCANGASAARSFVQIARRGCSVAAAAQSPALLDFLLPRAARLRLAGAPSRPSARKKQPSRPALLRAYLRSPQRRGFAASAVRSATRCVLNPRKDEDGNDMVMEITPRAAKRLSEIMKRDGNPDVALRVQVESGGCHGFQYLLSLVTIPPRDAQEWSSVVNDDDSIFQYYPDDADPGSETQGPRIILDEPSLGLLKGSKVDFTMELIGSQFKVDNPRATSRCGCGSSFDVDI